MFQHRNAKAEQAQPLGEAVLSDGSSSADALVAAAPAATDGEKVAAQKRKMPDWLRNLGRKMYRARHIYLMLLPVVVFYIVYCYVPMYGIVLAWKEWRPKYGILGSPWVGWENFETLFSQQMLPRAIRNTVVISALKLLICFPLPILFALLLNELTNKKFKKTVQTFMYLPNFISWVILGGIVKMLLAMDDGLINNIIVACGGERVSFLTNPGAFYPILILSEIWKGTGWGTIIYTAAIAGIDPTLYEAAKIDGCKRAGLIFRITLPMILPVCTVMFIMQLSNIMNAGFDPVYNLYNKNLYETADIIDTYVYRLFTESKGGNGYALSTAVNFFKTVINFLFLIAGNIITKKINGYSMFTID